MLKKRELNFVNFIKSLNLFVFGVTAFLVLVSYLSTNCLYGTESITEEIKPYATARLLDGDIEYFFDLSHYDSRYTGIMVYTSHQKVQAYNLGSEIYSFTKTGGFWTSTTGSKYNIIEIDDKMANIAVVVSPVYDVVKDQELTFYIGSSYRMFREVLIKSVARFLVSLLILITSIFLFIYYVVMKNKQKLPIAILYLAYFAFFCGLWSLVETNFSSLIVTNRIVESNIPYLCLMLVNPPFILFFDEYLELKSRWFKQVIVCLSMGEFIILSALHLTKIAEFRTTLPIMQFMLVLTAVYLVVRVVIKLIKRCFSRQLEICAIGLSLFMLAMVVDLVKYYTATGDADSIGRYMFLIFIILLAADLIKGTYEIIEKGRQAKQLEAFALTDTMTGLLNRNAFESIAAANKSNLNGLIAVVADANGLKKCNDTFGHEAGDEYISIVAEIFSNVYGKYGNCYRTGGDEFCCIIPSGRHLNMERLNNLFKAKIYTENLEGGYQYDIAVAIGYASYNPNVDEDFRAVVKRADDNMYENKRETKKLG